MSSSGSSHLPPIHADSKSEWLPKRDHSVYSPSPTNINRRYVYELEEQVKLLKEDNHKKDELIQKLSCMDIKESHTVSHTLDSHTRQFTKSDNAALQVKIETLITELREMECDLQCEKDRTSNLKKENETLREDVARLTCISENLKIQLHEVGNKEETFETLRSRNETAVKTLQEEYRRSQDKIVDLESRIRCLLNDREKVELEKHSSSKVYSEFLSELIHLLGVDSDTAADKVLMKVADLMQETVSMKTKMLGLNEALATAEHDQKTTREALTKLVEEMERERDEFGQHVKSRQELKEEVQNLKRENDRLQEEVEEWEKKFEQSERSLHSIQSEFRQLEINHIRLKEESHENSFEVNNHKKLYQSLLESMAALLSSAYSHCPPNESAVKERLRALLTDLRDRKEAVDSLEQRLKSLSRKAEFTVDNLRSKEIMAKRTESDYLELTERVRVLEADLAAADVISSGLKADKEKFSKFLRQLTIALNLKDLKSDASMDKLTETIFSRVESFGRVDMMTVHDQVEQVNKLKQRLKQSKEELENKEIVVNLLRQKLRNIKQTGKKGQKCSCTASFSGSASDSQEEDPERESLKKKLEKSRRKWKQLKEENVQLKNKLLHHQQSSDKHYKFDLEKRELYELQATVDKLERVRQKQAEKIAKLNQQLKENDKFSADSRLVAENAVQSLSNELRATKKLLEEAQRKERQLMDFRVVIGRMLGLHVDELAIPDYEIIRRLEQLIQGDSSVSLENHYIHDDVVDCDKHGRFRHEHWRSGEGVPPSHPSRRPAYEDARRLLGPRHRSSQHHRHGRTGHFYRTHSVSPDGSDSRRY